MYTLYWEYMAGSIVVQAMLEEMRANYRLRHVDMAADEHRSPAYLSCVPSGRVPAIELPDGTTIGETAAIVTLLGEHFYRSGLVPVQVGPERAGFLYWLNVMTTAGYLTVSRKCHPERYASSPDAIRQVEVAAAAELDAFFDMMNGAIAGKPYFLKHGHSALDFYLAMLAEWSADKDALLASRPALAELVRATTQRPAYRTTMETHLLPSRAA